MKSTILRSSESLINRTASARVRIGVVLLIAALNCGAVDVSEGILRKPIPEKLVVLTFDDGPASGYTVVVPTLKSLGFGGSFYVCDFDSFHTRKDWYLTWRQMKSMADAGFEIGNHTMGHVGGASIDPFLNMEDELLANNVPKPTTIAWPVHQVNTSTYPELAAHGYVFGRGGHFRPYRPTVDNPFDIPCMGAGTMEEFEKSVRQATGGRIVVLIYHGVPDIEHPAVSLDPAVFKAQMRYLKENHYRVIALRDLAEFIDPAQAAKLPPTAKDFKDPNPPAMIMGNKPYVAPDLTKSDDAKKAPQGNPKKMPAANAEGSSLLFATGQSASILPEIHPSASGDVTVEEPITLNADLLVNPALHRKVNLGGPLSGSGRLIKNGEGQLQVSHTPNTYSGGTVINGGSLLMMATDQGLGSGPITLNPDAVLALERVNGSNPLVLNGGTIHAGNGFGDSWSGTITVNGNVDLTSYADFVISASISGPGGLTHIGGLGAFGPSNSGTVTLAGSNNYTGPTIARRGWLRILKSAALYHGDHTCWTPANITVHPAATLVLSVGGPGEFTSADMDTILGNLTKAVHDNGLLARSVLSLDIAKGDKPVTVSVDVTDSKGPGGGAYVIEKRGAGTLELTGSNTFSGRTVLAAGALRVASINNVSGGKPASGLGAPRDVESGEIFLGNDDGECSLVHTGPGETSDRVMNLAGKDSTVSFEQAGNGLWKLTSNFVISGYGSNKTIILTASASGSGEIAGSLTNPYDRAGKATTAITKSGPGTWTLSGENTYSGPTKVAEGTLLLANPRSLSDGTDVHLSAGAKLKLDFNGNMRVRKLFLDGKQQPPGVYHAANSPVFIEGAGTLECQ